MGKIITLEEENLFNGLVRYTWGGMGWEVSVLTFELMKTVI